MKKFIAVLATVGMVAALAAGCGSGDDASADKGTKTGSASSDWDSSNDIIQRRWIWNKRSFRRAVWYSTGS